MIRTEQAQLLGYVYVDVAGRDIGGYVADAKRVDAKKYPKVVAGQNCSNCALYQGKATDKQAGCPLFGTKQVAGQGWCSAWAKKA